MFPCCPVLLSVQYVFPFTYQSLKNASFIRPSSRTFNCIAYAANKSCINLCFLDLLTSKLSHYVHSKHRHCVCVCVCERERERESVRVKKTWWYFRFPVISSLYSYLCLLSLSIPRQPPSSVKVYHVNLRVSTVQVHILFSSSGSNSRTHTCYSSVLKQTFFVLSGLPVDLEMPSIRSS